MTAKMVSLNISQEAADLIRQMLALGISRSQNDISAAREWLDTHDENTSGHAGITHVHSNGIEYLDNATRILRDLPLDIRPQQFSRRARRGPR